MSMADVGAGGEEAVVTFESIAILTPRYTSRDAKIVKYRLMQ